VGSLFSLQSGSIWQEYNNFPNWPEGPVGREVLPEKVTIILLLWWLRWLGFIGNPGDLTFFHLGPNLRKGRFPFLALYFFYSNCRIKGFPKLGGFWDIKEGLWAV